MFVLALSACGGGEAATDTAEPSSTETPPTTSAEHRESRLACEHFRNVAQDAADGVLTVPELREKLQEVEGNASIATPAVQEAARETLAAITSGSPEDMEAAVQALSQACSEAGW